MYLKYGSYTHAQNEPAIQIGKRALLPLGFRQSVRETWRIAGVHAADQPSLTAAIAALTRGVQRQRSRPGTLPRRPGDARTDHVLISSAALGGTPSRALEFPSGGGARYSTFRNYSIAVEADFPDVSNNLLDYSETLLFEGRAARA
jgi:hypothetical protein